MKHLLSIFLFSVVLFSGAMGQTKARIEKMLAEGEKLKQARNFPLALAKYNQVIHLQPENFEGLWNAAMLSIDMGGSQQSEEVRQNYYVNAKKLAERAMKANPEDSKGYMAHATALERYGSLVSGRERVSVMNSIKKSALEAIRYDNECAEGWHMLGRWNFFVANMTWTEKAAANVVLGGLPKDGSNENAVKAYKNAIEFAPKSIQYHRDLAEVYNLMGQRALARENCLKCLNLRPQTLEDPKHQADCANWLREMN